MNSIEAYGKGIVLQLDFLKSITPNDLLIFLQG